MSIEVKKFGDVRVLSIKGNMMGGHETISVHEKVKELADAGNKEIVIDLSKVMWMNSSGLGTLLGCLRSTVNRAGELKLAGPTEKITSLLMITKFTTEFDIYENVDKAVKSFSEGEKEEE